MEYADSGSSAGYGDSGWESLSSSTHISSSSNSGSDEAASVLRNDANSTSAFEVSVAEASPPTQVEDDHSIPSLLRVGSSSENFTYLPISVQGSNQAETDDDPPQPEALAEAGTGGVEPTKAYQRRVTVSASTTGESREQHQETGTEPSHGSSDFGLGPTAVPTSGQALASSSLFAPGAQESSKPAASEEASQGDLPSRVAEARLSRAALFDRAWLEGIRPRPPSGGDDACTRCPLDQQTHAYRQTRKRSLKSTAGCAASAGGSYAGIRRHSGRRPADDATPAVGASAGLGGGEGGGPGSGRSQEKSEGWIANLVWDYPAWNEQQQPSSLAHGGCEALVERVLRQTASCGGNGGESSRTFQRPWHPSQWEAFQLQGCPPPPLDCSKMTIPRSLLGRVGANAAMERLRFPPTSPPPPPAAARSRDRWEPMSSSKAAGRSTKRANARRNGKAVSAYLSMKAEEIRTRRDHEGWLSRVEAGLDTPIQDPLSLLGGSVESTRRIKETFTFGRMRPRDTEDRSLRPVPDTFSLRTVGDYAGGAVDGRVGSSDEGSAPEDDGVAATERRYCLSTAHLEDLVVSSRCLMAEEEERSARESSDQRERWARTNGHLFEHVEESNGRRRSHHQRGSREPVEAFARRCLAESREISA